MKSEAIKELLEKYFAGESSLEEEKLLKEVFMKEKSMKAKGDEDEVANPVQKIKPGQKKDMASLFGTSPDQKKKEEAMRKAEEDRE